MLTKTPKPSKLFQVLEKVQAFVEKKPIIGSSIQYGITMSTGDILAQKFFDGKPWSEIDWIRVGRFSLLGFAVLGPLSGAIKIVGRQFNVVKDPKLLFKRLFPLDYFVGFPLSTVVGISLIGLMQNLNIDQIKTKVQQEFAWVYLPLCIVQLTILGFNFLVLRPKYWYSLQTGADFFWNAYFSKTCNKSISK